MAKITQLPSGSYHAQMYAGKDEQGKRKYKSFTGGKEEVKKAVAKFQYEYDRNQKPATMSLGVAMNNYTNSRINILSPRTTESYNYIRKMLFEELLDIPISSLDNEIIQAHFNKLANKVSPKTSRNAYGFLSAVFKEFRPDYRLNIRLPKKSKVIYHIPDGAELEKIIEAVDGTDLELPVLLACWLGMRAGEIVGLRWENVTGTKLIIKTTRVYVNRQLIEKPPKSYAGIRELPLPPYIATLIAQQPKTSEYIVPMSGQMLYKRFVRMLEKNGLPHCRLHDLRHANASIMLQLGIPDKYAMERLGHATNSTLKNVYQHTFTEARKTESDKVNIFFSSIMQHEKQHKD